MEHPSSRQRPAGETGGSEQRPAREVAAPALGFDLAAHLESIKRERSWERGDRDGRTLVKEPNLQIVLTALKPGARLVEHRTAGAVSIQTIEGCLRLQLGEHTVDLPAGWLLAIEPGVAHDVEALEESAFLLTISGASS